MFPISIIMNDEKYLVVKEESSHQEWTETQGTEVSRMQDELRRIS
jgi:hypothetical protein